VTAIACEGISLSYGKRRIISGVSFCVPDGAFVGVLGPNGAGKTTLLRAILGLIAPDAGRIAVLGGTPHRGNAAIGYMPQARRAMPDNHLSGFDLVLSAASGQRFGWPMASREEKRAAAVALDRVGASELAKRPVAELSGGERQRILIAQALIGNPKLLLLDEPLMYLDPKHQSGIIELVHDIGRELQIAVLFCAHEINPLLKAVDLVLYLGNGHAAMGSVDEVINSQVLSALYDAPIHVLRVNGRIFVMTENVEVEGHTHAHHA
jgi:zinc/manganese transport system ATP-binding protein